MYHVDSGYYEPRVPPYFRQHDQGQSSGYSAQGVPQAYQGGWPYTPAIDINQVNTPSQGWTKIGYNQYPKKKNSWRHNQSKKSNLQDLTDDSLPVCTVFNKPMEDIYKENPQ